MADPEQIYQEVLAEEQQKGSAPAVAEGRAKAARVRAEHGSPHPKEPKWWPGAQPHLEGGGAPTEAPAAEAPAAEPEPGAAEPEPAPAEAAPAPEPTPTQAPAETAPQPATAPAAQAEPTRGDELAAAAATTQPAAAAVPPAPEPAQTPAAMAPDARPAGVTHGTTTGTRLRPEDEVTTDAQFEGQKAMYERRKVIDDLVSTGVPAVSAADTGRSGSPLLALLYVLIPLIAIGFIAGRPSTPASSGEHPPEDGATGGAITLVAQGIAFDQNQLSLPADGATVTLDNRDTAPHNLAVYANAEDGAAFASPLFDGPEIGGGDSIEYEVPPLEPGDYYFQCDLHPGSMNGSVTVQ
ncbi:MAG TPA: cupredoxin domain-containing protein [Actinomycetota bacterium]|nr:cupredoxin domain-containing protein [Actinomycetota bacterium]